MKFDRRSILKAIGMVPAAAHVAAERVKIGLMRDVGTFSIGGHGSLAPVEQGEGTFFSFKEWFDAFGHDRAWGRSREVSGLDADLIEMRLPLATKVRMQQARQYDRIVENERRRVEKRLLRGPFTDYD